MVPLAGFLLVPLGLAAAMMVFIWQPGAVLLFKAAALCTDFFLSLSDIFYAVLGNGITMTTPLFWEVVFFYGFAYPVGCMPYKETVADCMAADCLAFFGAACSQALYARPA